MIGMIPYFICFVVLALIFVLFPRKHATKRVAVILLVLSFLGELFICNFHSFHLLGGGYEVAPIDLTAEYNLAGYNYTLRDLGDGFAMFDGAVNVLDYVMEDYMVLANYIQGFEGGVVGATNSPLLAKYAGMKLDYGTTSGSGRITVVSGDQDGPEGPADTSDTVMQVVAVMLLAVAGTVALLPKRKTI